MLQSENKEVKRRFEVDQPWWQEIYYRSDYMALARQWRQNDCVLLCQKHLPKNSTILDLGCGTGHASLTLAQLGYNVVGIDFSEAMVKQAQRNAETMRLQEVATFRQADFVKDTDTLGFYDGLIALGFIAYFDNPIAVLQKMHSLLNDQGIAIVQIWNSKPFADKILSPLYNYCNKWIHPINLSKQIAKCILPRTIVNKFRKPIPPSRQNTVKVTQRRYTPTELDVFARKADFTIIDARGSLFFPDKFFLNDDRKTKWDKQLQAFATKNEFLKTQAVNYVAVLQKGLEY